MESTVHDISLSTSMYMKEQTYLTTVFFYRLTEKTDMTLMN